jgi:hypothetical protein
MALNLSAGAFHEVAKLYMRWAGSLTGPAIQAEVHVRDKIGRHAQAPFIDRLDEVNPTAWGIHFCPQGAVGGAFIQTQPAMDTGRNFFLLWTLKVVKDRK